MQPHELYRSQQYATAIYRSELALRLKGQGYEIERGKSGQPEIAGYTREYMDASSPRSQQIQAYLLEQQGVKGAGAAQIAAHRPATTSYRPSRTRKCRECIKKWLTDLAINLSR